MPDKTKDLDLKKTDLENTYLENIDIDELQPDDIDAALGETPYLADVPDTIDIPEPLKTLALILASDTRFHGGDVSLIYYPGTPHNIKVATDRTDTPAGVCDRAVRLLGALHHPDTFEMFAHLPQKMRPANVQMDLGTIRLEGSSGHMALQALRDLECKCHENKIVPSVIESLVATD